MEQSEKTLDMIVNLCKNRGYVFPGSEIYGGLANSWDYGPLGVEFKNNVKKAWLKKFVQESPYNVGLDAAILMNPQTWVTTGHVAGFSDPLLDCRACKARHRADKLIGDEHPEVNVDAMSFDEMDAFIAEHEDVVCPVCGKHDFTPIRKFNLMFKTAIGVTEDSSSTCYLRPETAQGIFVNFANIQRTTRRKLPFGVCQVGKAFRNEITPGNFTFRTREFEQMECEFFCKPGTDLEWFSYWKDYCENWLLSLGIKKEHLRLRDHEPAELAFYSRATTDIEYAFPFTDWGELWGIADRTNYDLSRHQEASWVTTGHVAGFSDPLLDCRACKARHRADKLIGDEHPEVNVDAMSFDEMDAFIAEHEDVVCPVCGKHDFTPIRKFNLMFKTAIGVTEDSSSTCYLRPETAQGIFVNFANIQRTTRRKLPFGVCQVGKAFRNEITPGNFTFRTREFEQMECEFFCKPGTDLEWFSYWKDYCENWLLSLGIKKEHLRLRDHEPAELAFYSRATTDIEYAFPFTDWGELWGIADRTNYDLSRHQEASGKSLEYFDSETNEHYIPYVIEPSLGCDRVALAFLCEAYDEEHLTDSKGKEDIRTVLHLHPALAPYKCAVLPLSKKLGDKAMEIRNELSKYFMVDYDDTGSIGKRYRREDEIGTPYCITVDFDTVGDEAKGIAADNCVTVRDRDTMEQVRMPISELKAYIESKIEF